MHAPPRSFVSFFGTLFLLTVLVARSGLAEGLKSVHPALEDSVLVCRVNTHGLPGSAARETILSGLPSAMMLGLSVLDQRGKSVNDSRVEIRIEPDLWEQVFLVRTPLFDARLSSVAAVEELLRSMPRIPVAPVHTLHPDHRYKIRVRLAVHALAPSQLRRSRQAYFDEDLDASERREVSIGLGSLLRFFLDGDDGDETWLSESSSEWFRLGDLFAAPTAPTTPPDTATPPAPTSPEAP